MFGNLGQAKKYLGQAAKMLIGIPDYDNYVEHMKTNHPDKPYMSLSLIHIFLSAITKLIRGCSL